MNGDKCKPLDSTRLLSEVLPAGERQVLTAPLDAPPARRDTLAGASGVHQSERLSAVFCSIPTRTPVGAGEVVVGGGRVGVLGAEDPLALG